MKGLMPKIHKTKTNLTVGFAVFVLVGAILSVSVRGHAAGSTQMYISPATDTVTQGNNETFDVLVNTNGDSVNAVQTTVSFDSSAYSFVSVSAGDFSIGFTHSETSNSVNFAGGSTTGLTGTKIAATITLNAIAGASGSAVTLSSICTGTTDSTCSAVLDSSFPNGNDLVSITGASFDVTPLPPSNTSLPVVSGSTTVGSTLSTTNGSWDNSPTSYGYQWEDCDSGGANCSNVASGGTSSTYVLAGGDSGFTIRAVVTATNSGGSGNATSAATAVVTTPVCTIPSTPGTPSLTASTYTTISLSWSASTANDPCTLSGYRVYRALVVGGNPGSYSLAGTAASESFDDSGLTAGNSYSYYIVAYDSGGDDSDNGSAATLATSADNEPPTAPTNVKLTLDGPSQVDLSWTASTENPNLGGVGIDHYAVSRATVTGGVVGSYNQVGTSNGAATNFQDNNVTSNPGTAYSYEVTGVDAFNSSNASAAAATQTFTCTTVNSNTTCTLDSSTDLSTTDAIVVANETLVNDGMLCDTTIHNNSFVKGTGSFCDLVVNGGGNVSPGHSPGCTTVNGNLTESGTYTAEVQSPGVTACTDFDQIVVSGTINLSGGTLDTELLGGFAPSVGQSFEIINNQGSSPISGTFNGLSEGAVFAVGSSRMQISYRGGANSNSVVLTVVNPNTPITATPTAPNTGFKLVSASASSILIATVTAGAVLLLIAYRLGWVSAGSVKRAGR